MKCIARVLPITCIALITIAAPACGDISHTANNTSTETASPTAVSDAKTQWSQFRGPGGKGVSAQNPPTQWSPDDNIAWKVALPGPGTSSPIVFGDRIYLTAYTGYNVPGEQGKQEDLQRHLLCLSRKDGSTIWTKAIKAKLPEQDRIRDDHGYASSTPVADKEGIYLFYGKSGAMAYDHTGKEIWTADVGSGLNGWGSAASPVLYGDMVIINASVESESLIALDKRSGKEKWRLRGIKESWNTPILVDVPAPAKDGVKTELIVAIAGSILGVNPDTGAQLWSCKTNIGWYMVPSMVSSEGIVYALGGRSGVASLAVRTGGRGEVTASHRLWTSVKGSNVSSPIYHEGRLYWMHDNLGIAYCADAKTGDVIYEERIDRVGQVYGSPVMAGGRIYYTSREGRTIVVAAKPEFEQLAKNEVESRGTFNGSIAVDGDQILMRSNKFLYCIGAK